jgi:hypothetical protein
LVLVAGEWWPRRGVRQLQLLLLPAVVAAAAEQCGVAVHRSLRNKSGFPNDTEK